MLRLARPLTAVSRTAAAARLAPLSARAQSSSAAQEWIKDMTARPATESKDHFDTLRAAQFKATIPTDADAPAGYGVSRGDDVPKGMHLIYFQPTDAFADLAKDGTSAEYNAPEPYIRRMWAGGWMEWNPNSRIRLGDEVEQAVRVARAEEKAGMMFVYQARELGPKGGDWAVREERTHVFFPPKQEEAKGGAKPGGKKKPAAELPKPDLSFSYTPTSPLLFRYSAMTWNGHKIHYDREWTTQVEGHPDLVVHGPLNATLLVQLADRAAGDVGAHLTRFQYRATSPMYVDRPISINAAWKDGKRGADGELELWAEQGGKVGMKATATFAAA